MEVLVQGISECGISPNKAAKFLVLCANNIFWQTWTEFKISNPDLDEDSDTEPQENESNNM